MAQSAQDRCRGNCDRGWRACLGAAAAWYAECHNQDIRTRITHKRPWCTHVVHFIAVSGAGTPARESACCCSCCQPNTASGHAAASAANAACSEGELLSGSGGALPRLAVLHRVGQPSLCGAGHRAHGAAGLPAAPAARGVRATAPAGPVRGQRGRGGRPSSSPGTRPSCAAPSASSTPSSS